MLSGMTGGRAVRLTSSFDSAFTQLDSGLTGYYRLGVQALPEDLDGKNHRISLEVSRKAATLVGYRRVMAATPQTPAAPVAPEVALSEAVKGGPPQTGVDLRATSYVFHGITGTRDLRVVAVGDVGRAATGKATVVAALYELDGRPATATQNSVEVPASGRAPLGIEVTAAPGTYVLRLAVLDAGGHIGSLERLVEARWQKAGPIETPGLVLFRAGAETAARPVFDVVRTTDRLIAQVALAGPVEERWTEVTFAIAKMGSKTPIVERSGRIAETMDGTLVAEETIPVSTLEPGRYTVSATIRPGGAGAFTRTISIETPAAARP
jgi:hypothetical protein